MLKTIGVYDLVFYIKPEFELVPDGVRSIDSTYQKEIDEIFQFLLNTNPIDYHLLTGDVQTRLDQIDQAIEQKQMEIRYDS